MMSGWQQLARGMSDGALRGCRVLDFGTAWAGCIPGHILADFGAEVIKIESQERVDLLRYGPGPNAPMRGKPWHQARECNPWFHTVNRGKLGVTINFTSRERVPRLDVGIRYLRGGRADYLTEGSVRREDGQVIRDFSRSRIDRFGVYIGVVFGR